MSPSGPELSVYRGKRGGGETRGDVTFWEMTENKMAMEIRVDHCWGVWAMHGSFGIGGLKSSTVHKYMEYRRPHSVPYQIAGIFCSGVSKLHFVVFGTDRV